MDHQPLRVDGHPGLGHGGVLGARGVGSPAPPRTAPIGVLVGAHAPLPDATLADVVAELRILRAGLAQVDAAVRMPGTPADDIALGFRSLTCAQHDTTAVLNDILVELQTYRLDLESRRFSARCTRAWAWLKGFFVWPSPD